MKDGWLDRNTDKLLLYSLVILGGVVMMHAIHHAADGGLIEWLENAFSTILGALILILTGRNKPNADAQSPVPATPIPQGETNETKGSSGS